MPFTVTLAWPSLTVPRTMSLISPDTVMNLVVTTEPAAGESTVRYGGVRSRDTEMVAVASATPFTTRAMMALLPSASATLAWKVPLPLILMGVPLIVSAAVLSLTVP